MFNLREDMCLLLSELDILHVQLLDSQLVL